MTTLIGFDYGTKWIGLAVGQTLTATATPLTALPNKGAHPDWAGIELVIRTWQPDALVVGLPFNMDDTEADPAPKMRRFANQLKARFGLPVHHADERLTSIESRRQLGIKTKGRVPGLDAYAAKLILETWLSEHPHL